MSDSDINLNRIAYVISSVGRTPEEVKKYFDKIKKFSIDEYVEHYTNLAKKFNYKNGHEQTALTIMREMNYVTKQKKGKNRQKFKLEMYKLQNLFFNPQ